MPEIGDSLGRYTLLKKLASGGMGEVFLAAKPGPVGFGPPVALKVLREQLASDQQFIDMLVDEANISMFLQHQNVVSVLDLSEDQGTYYIAMEYVQGVTVEALIERLVARSRRVDLPVALFIATELCRALKYAHTRVNHAGEPLNIIHRDVTPANILLSTQGEVKLTDFGIARAKGRIHQTQAGVLKGKFGYMAPEMIRYEAIDARADLFCAGVVIYLMITGRHPVAGATVMEAIQRYEDKQIPRPSTIVPEVPGSLDHIVMRALEPQPDNRWASAAALGAALQDVVLKNPQWRRDVQDGAHRLSELLRDIAPECFADPVPADVSEALLRSSLQREGLALPSLRPGSSTGPSPVVPVVTDDLPAALADTAPPPSPLAPSREKVRRGMSGPVTDRAASALVMESFNQTTSEAAVPPHLFDVGVGSDPAISTVGPRVAEPAAKDQDLETEEGFSLADVHAAHAELVVEQRRSSPPAAAAKRTGQVQRRPTVQSPARGQEIEESGPEDIPTGIAPQAVTVALQAIVDGAEPAVEVGFPDSSTDRHRLHDSMMSEPALPKKAGDKAARAPLSDDWGAKAAQEPTVAGFDYEAELAARGQGQRASTLEDGRTQIGMYALAEPDPTARVHDTDEGPLPDELAHVGGPEIADDGGKTIMGMAMPDWSDQSARLEAPGGSTVSPAPSAGGSGDATRAYEAVDASLARGGFREGDDAETIIPLGPQGGKLDVSDWARDPIVPAGDSTLLDGMDAGSVAEALARQRGERARDERSLRAMEKSDVGARTQFGALAEPSAAITDSDELRPAEPDFDMDQIVADSLRTGKHAAVVDKTVAGQVLSGPALLNGPVRISFGPDGAPILGGSGNGSMFPAPEAAAAALAASAANPEPVLKKKTAPVVRERKRTAHSAEPELPEVTPGPPGNFEVGAATGRWMAGQLDAGELSWDDDAAARRAVATRNAGGQQPSRSSPAVAPYVPQGQLGGMSGPGGSQAAGANSGPGFGGPGFGGPGFGGPGSIGGAGVRYTPPLGTPGPDPRGFAPPGAQQVPGASRTGPAPARNWAAYVALAGAFLAVGVVTGVLLFTRVLWPKLKLESDPPGATVIVDGKTVEGRAPVTVKVEPEQPHTIELRMEGYRSERREITDGVGRGRTYALQVPLHRVTSTLDIGPVPGTVYVNGKEAGRGTRVQLGELAPDAPVRVRVEAPGHRAWEQLFERGSQVPESFDVSLPPNEEPKKEAPAPAPKGH